MISDWSIHTLGNLIDTIKGGGTPSRDVSKYWGDGIPWATVKDLVSIKLDRTQESITQEGLDNSSANLIPAGTLIVATRMALGKIAVFSKDVAINQDLKALSPKSELDNLFLLYWYQSKAEDILALGTGSTVKGIRQEVLLNLNISLPILQEQKKIAVILSTVDEKIENIRQQIEQTKELKKGLMQQLLTKGIGHTSFKDSPLGKIPESWEVVRIDEISDVTAGGTPSTKVDRYWGGNIPWMNSGEINLRRVTSVEGRITKDGLNNSSTRIIPKNSVLIALAGQGKTRGKVAINEIDLCTNQSLAAIICDNTIDFEYIFQNLESRYEEIRKMSTGDGGRGGLNLKIIKSIPIALPSIEEQRKVSEVLSSIDDKVDCLLSKVNKYTGLKQGLMQQLLTGKIRVKLN